MEPQVELLNLIVKTVKEECEIDVSLDGTPFDGGVSAELAPGYNDTLYYSKQAIKVIPVLFLSKDRNQSTCLNALCKICNHLQVLKKYPQAEGFVWLDAVTGTEPNKIGRQEDGNYLYSAIVNAKIYF